MPSRNSVAVLLAASLCWTVACGRTAHDDVVPPPNSSGTEPDARSCEDADLDGLSARACGGSDCDDSDSKRGGPDTNGLAGPWQSRVVVKWDGIIDDTRDSPDLVIDSSGTVHMLGAHARCGSLRHESTVVVASRKRRAVEVIMVRHSEPAGRRNNDSRLLHDRIASLKADAEAYREVAQEAIVALACVIEERNVARRAISELRGHMHGALPTDVVEG